jgi:hypothetical protein
MLRVTTTWTVSNGTTFGPVCDVPVYVRGDGADGPHEVAISFSKDTTIYGRFLTMTGHIELGNNNDLFGQFVGRSMGSDPNDNVTGCSHEETTTTTSTVTIPQTSTTTTVPETTTTVPETTTTVPETTTTVPETTTTIPQSTTTSTEISASTTIVPTSVVQSTTTVHDEGSTIPVTTTTPTTTVTPTTTPNGPLPFTGSNAGLMNVGFVVLLAGGAIVGLAMGRRRVR